MKLYKLSTGLGDYWVIAKDPTSAENKLMKILDDEDYGFASGRTVTVLTLIAESIDLDKKPFHMTGKFLVI